MSALHLALHFVNRDIRSRYLGSFSGGLWALMQPLIQLGVYSFVWIYVFRMGSAIPDPPGIVPFLAMGLWPWNALSESINRATTSMQDNAALIGKVALPREVLVFASVSSTFLLHGVGFFLIMSVLGFTGTPIHIWNLPLALLGLLQLFMLSLGLAFLFSSVQVFVRDLAQVLIQILPLWMFVSPVLYPRTALPARYQAWLDWNPFTFYAEYFRAILLGSGAASATSQIIALAVALSVLLIGLIVFRRLSPHFEDFL